MKAKARTCLYFFIMLQPFLDLYWFYHGRLADLLPFTLPTVLRLAAIAVICALFFSQKQNWQKLGRQRLLLCYIVLLLLYCLFHLYHVRHFISVNPTNYGYSTGGEIFYLIRLMLPLSVIYFSKELTFSKEQFKKVILTLSALFSLTIVFSNLLLISLRAYGNGQISANIFAWFFNPQIGYSHLASKGFFNFSNMVSAVLFALLPLMVYYLFSSFSWLTTALLAFQALAMLEIGTKVAAIGLIGGIAAGLIIYFLHLYLFKNIKKNSRALLAAVLIEAASLAIVPFGPAVQRYQYEKYLASQSDHDLSREKRQLQAGLRKYPRGAKREAFLRQFIKENYHAYALNRRFVLQSYPYQYDPEFWLGIMREPGDLRMQNRHLEQAMLDRVVAKNNNQGDHLWGISYTRENHIFNLERDFSSQIYSLGWIGMILFLGPYVLIWLYGLYHWFVDKKRRTYAASSLLAAILFLLLAAYASGNVIDFLTASFILAFLDANLLVWSQPMKKQQASLLTPKGKSVEE